ncbi:hypothetical protein BOC40_01430 [Burkholderia pseudomallei]|uniref:hypothetical protein n=1 Tax=Burkholderia pseudomallei TaxID=28450 RepID=UPI000A1A1BC2|nr:hypothetical protein [Burkholderia pseudomallei]ARK79240.1 hypothetical protein BOC40_01430 [Burkholderia pseudomallei]ARL47184.1 hypothetical protein BOC50_30500 [Burkholderia pseudomallei]
MSEDLASIIGLPEFDEARSASATIKGYLFQFDATIDALLNCGDDSPVRMEGVEDFDIATGGWTRCVQCKYYEGTELSKQVLREVVVPMLRRLKEVRPEDWTRWQFSLYGHFKSQPAQAVTQMTEAQVFDCLQTYKTVKGMPRQAVNIAADEGFDRALISAFASQFTVHSVPDFETHRAGVIQRLQKVLGASESAVREIHYPSALYYVARLAATRAAEERISTRSEFLSAARPTPDAVNGLLLQAFGERRYCAAMRRRYFTALNREPLHHAFAIHHQAGGNDEDLLNALRTIATKYSSAGSRRRPENERRVPIILLAGMPHEIVLKVKGRLFGSNYPFNDGFSFQGATFDPMASLGVSTSSGPSQFALLDRVEQLAAVCGLRRPMTAIHLFSSSGGVPIEVSDNVVDMPVGSFNWISNIV